MNASEDKKQREIEKAIASLLYSIGKRIGVRLNDYSEFRRIFEDNDFLLSRIGRHSIRNDRYRTSDEFVRYQLLHKKSAIANGHTQQWLIRQYIRQDDYAINTREYYGLSRAVSVLLQHRPKSLCFPFPEISLEDSPLNPAWFKIYAVAGINNKVDEDGSSNLYYWNPVGLSWKQYKILNDFYINKEIRLPDIEKEYNKLANLSFPERIALNATLGIPYYHTITGHPQLTQLATDKLLYIGFDSFIYILNKQCYKIYCPLDYTKQYHFEFLGNNIFQQIQAIDSCH
jgi:hypothetical protein